MTDHFRSTIDRDAIEACARELLQDPSLGTTYVELLSALDGLTDKQRHDASILAVRHLDDHLDALTSRITRDYPSLKKREVTRAAVEFATATRSRAGLT